MPSKYKITNVTIRKPRLNPRTGLDMRSAGERVGHPVGIRVGSEDVIVHPQRARLFDNITDGMLGLRDGKFITIEEIHDVGDVLKSHVSGVSSLGVKMDGVHPAAEARDARLAKAVPMGEDGHAQASGKEVEGAVNPDGDPNFLVRADKNLKRKTKSVEEPAAEPLL